MSVAEAILAEVRGEPEGTVLSAKALLHLGGRAAVDQALSRLTRSGHLIRAARGLYVLPVEGRFGTRPPSPVRVAEHLAHATGEPVLPAGAAEANRLGLTTQVPVQTVFVTSGTPRRLSLGALAVEVKRAPRWQMLLPGTTAGAAVRAMAWLGRGEATRVAAHLHAALPQEEWRSLLQVRPRLPAWMAASIGAETGAAGHA